MPSFVSDFSLLNPDSLAETLHAVTDAFVDGVSIPPAERECVAVWIAGRQGQPRSYRGLPAPTHQDYLGARLYTGEALNSRASIGHIMGEEAARCLIQLDVPLPEVQQAIQRNTEIVTRFGLPDDSQCGYYCCGKCSLSFWRHLRVSAIADTEARIRKGLHVLSQCRAGNGRWRVFPYYYTLFTLLDINLPEATDELRYAAPGCERFVKHTTKDDRIAQRRYAIAERVLARCG